MNISAPTPVQAACIPKVMAGSDVIGTAQTGSGKTAAFALPILQLLAEDPYGIFALVLTPTRELAFQICDQFVAFGAGMTLHVLVVVGGEDMRRQASALARRPHVVVGTPGRLVDHLRSDPGLSAALRRVRFLVLDEADRLLEPAMEPELEAISEALPRQGRQTLLFSATITRGIAALQASEHSHTAFWRALCTYWPLQSALSGLLLCVTMRSLFLWEPLLTHHRSTFHRCSRNILGAGGDPPQGIPL